MSQISSGHIFQSSSFEEQLLTFALIQFKGSCQSHRWSKKKYESLFAMDLDRPLDDFIKDSLRAKRAKRGAVAGSRSKHGGRARESDPNTSKNNKEGARRTSGSDTPGERSHRPRSTITKRSGGHKLRGRPVRARASAPKTSSPTMSAKQQLMPHKRRLSPSRVTESLSPPLSPPLLPPECNHYSPPKTRGVLIAVTNLHPAVTRDDIAELFGTIGPLRSAVLWPRPYYIETGGADVVFHSMQDAVTAIRRYNGVPLDNQPLHITLVASHSTPNFRSAYYR